MSKVVFEKIKSLLDENNIDYIVKEHPPTRTSQESALHRGEPLKIGAKALLVKGKDGFVLCVIPADQKLDTKKVKKIIKSKNLRFATIDELDELTGLVPGSVPPFGSILKIKMIVDAKQFEEEWMAFNAGSLEISIKMKTKDYRKIVEPETVDIVV